MEEEEEPRGGGGSHYRIPLPRGTERRRAERPESTGEIDADEPTAEPSQPVVLDDPLMRDFLMRLMDERRVILDSKLSPRSKARLLETGRYPLSAVTGRSIRIFQSENVVYAILAFSLVVLLCLAYLTAKFGLPKEVTIAFVGTVVGGTTATVAQKLGRL